MRIGQLNCGYILYFLALMLIGILLEPTGSDKNNFAKSLLVVEIHLKALNKWINRLRHGQPTITVDLI